MSKTIYKYEVGPGLASLLAPEGAQFLSVQCQRGTPQVWALVDPSRESVTYPVAIFGTGHDVPASVNADRYVGTFQLSNGSLVFHLFIGASR